MNPFTPARLRVLSGLFVNLAAAWLTAAALTPNFVALNKPFNLIVLTYDTFGATVFLVLATKVEERLELWAKLTS